MKAINRYARRFVLIKVDSPQEMRWRMRVGVSTVGYESTIAALECTPKVRQPVRVIPVDCFAARTLRAAGSPEPSGAASDYKLLRENG